MPGITVSENRFRIGRFCEQWNRTRMLEGVQQGAGTFSEAEQPCVEDGTVCLIAGKRILPNPEQKMQQCAPDPGFRQLPRL